MAIRSASSSFQLLATLVLFALLVSPIFAYPVVVEENQSHDPEAVAAEDGKQPLVVSENHSGEAESPSLAQTFEDDKRRHHHHHHHRYGSYGGYGGYGGRRGYRYGGYGGLGGGGYGGRRGCMRSASTCMCHCMNGRVATATEVLQAAAATKTAKP